MIVEFDNNELVAYYEGTYRGKLPFQSSVVKQFQKVVNYMVAAPNFNELKKINSLRIHPLKKELTGKYAARINDQYRLIFRLNEEGTVEILTLEDLIDYH
ncbi:type II toxin-antitoxin system RelE/ParE family toxin [Runella limosa]|uniref:type II toxin-antitoxin system RelE/ParE family toxin n=1 Tax=Runella limosa TaxID=370978 RepID=UPI0003FD23C6|nr:type II toxin-antitoxin system RelE/ParE family toxin [Runella limosa]